MSFVVPDEDLRPKPPRNRDLGIGILGCGEIVNIAHLPAYRAAGLRVSACFDLNLEAATTTAEKFGIPVVCTSLDELISRTDVHIVDIAIHIEGRAETFETCVRAGKHILLQKPVAHSLHDAERLVRIAKECDIRYAVNQQSRWAGTHLLVRRWIEDGAIGRLNFLRLEMRGWQDDPATWYVKCPDFTLVDHGIHYFDLLRFFAGRDAVRVCAMQAYVPDQVNIAPVIYSATIDFGDGLLAEHCFNNKVETENPWSLSLFADGEEGSIWSDFSTVRLMRKDGEIVEQTPTSKWFPDAFLGPMADLMDAIVEEREPTVSGESNLGTMRLVFGALESAERGRFVFLK